MYEILKALMGLEKAARSHQTRAHWSIDDDSLRITIHLEADDIEFVDLMRQLVIG